ncbi:PREDICTED: protein-glutamine gamma-glutamyltransferase 5-like [Ficedula albicollis]|uniref:protein-glutamine gamma-glutamyltransferase 5-like n=1 Tax=Ficedula albicollis TaxID=59894 RepID=UPI0007AD864E|nr:PREDICTED: protein-glutamine gamma-glutamyltransferase 5-like [Ficedula albicollis]
MEVIELGEVDLNCPSNCQIHNTHFFGTDRQIIRRGQAFSFYARFQNREWDDSVDQAAFTVETGLRPCESNETKCTFPMGRCLDQTCWSASYKVHQPKCISISVFPPSNVCIGRYILNMQITSCGHTYQRCLGDFYVLFNPWCADDPVYLDNQAHREEYVLNEHGILYEGVHKHITSRPWHFGQFEDGILDICLKILDMGASYHHGSDRDHCWRNDPVHVSMVVNHMISSHTTNSIMKIPENNDYLKGTKPFSWNGSVPILQQWYSGRCRPVRYGYCGSLASVMCTVMRCLGIPSRVVTSFCFPCSIENPLGINEIFDSTGKNLCGKDKLWRYHCWNESWMARRDINQCCGDWQCLDPTPLETGRGVKLGNPRNIFNCIFPCHRRYHCWNESWMARRDINQCCGDWQCLDPTPLETGRGSACSGPTWVRSIREGELDLDYDGHHMFSRVNSNYVGWLSQNNAKRTKFFCDTWPCGQRLITKSVGSEQFEDITGAYKYELGSVKNKEAYYRAYRRIHPGYCNASNCHIDRELSSLKNPFLSDSGINMRLKMANCPMYGEDVQLNWLLENLRNENKTLKFNLCAQIITYSGCPMDQFWKDSVNVTLGPREVKKIPVCISYNQYGSYLCDHNIMKVVAVSDPECGEVLMVSRDIVVNRPPVIVKLLSQPRLKVPCTAEISFCNPLQEDMKNCVMTLEGCGLFKEPMTIDLGTLASNQQARTIVEFTPYRLGSHRLLANLGCHKFAYCKGCAKAEVCCSAGQNGVMPVGQNGSLPACENGSVPVNGSGPVPVADPAFNSMCEYICIPVCNPNCSAGGQPVYDFVYLPAGHPLCNSICSQGFNPSINPGFEMGCDPGFRVICETVPPATCAPMPPSMYGSVPAPASNPVCTPMPHVVFETGPAPTHPSGGGGGPISYSVSVPTNNAVSALLTHFMAGPSPSGAAQAVPMSAPPSYSMCSPVVHTIGNPMQPPTPLSVPGASISHVVCGSTPSPTAQPACGPGAPPPSQPPSAAAARGLCSSPAAQPLESPGAACLPCSPSPRPLAGATARSLSTPTPRSQLVGTSGSRSLCGSQWSPSYDTTTRLGSTWAPTARSLWSPEGRSGYSSTRATYGTLTRPPYSSLNRSSYTLSRSGYSTLPRSASPAPSAYALTRSGSCPSGSTLALAGSRRPWSPTRSTLTYFKRKYL